MESTWAAILAASTLIPSPSAGPARTSAAPTAYASIPLAEIAARTGATVRRETLGRELSFSAGFGADEEPRVAVTENGVTAVFTLAQLEAGAASSYKVTYSKGRLSAPGMKDLTLDELLQAAYDRAVAITFPAGVKYALLAQGRDIVKLRKDADGMFWISYHPEAKLKTILWLLGVNGTLYGARLDGENLTFWSEPVPPVKAR